MPRLKSSTYLEHRRFLNYAWDHFKIIYGVLSFKQQTDLHRYFQTEADLPDDELLANRTAMTAADPSLPNRAGKAFVQLDGAFRYAYEHSNGDLVQFHRAVQQLTPNRYEHVTTVRRGAATVDRRMKAVPIMRRTIDAKLLAKALLMQVGAKPVEAADQSDHAACH